jgi:hypothetical protein
LRMRASERAPLPPTAPACARLRRSFGFTVADVTPLIRLLRD